jgi:heme exporter protein A
VILTGADKDAACHFLGHSDAVKPAETAGEQARFWASYFGRPASAANDALDRVGLSRRADVPGRGLSAGQKRRLAVARLLIDPRPVWLLDEPTAALDVEGRGLIDQLVTEHLATGGLVVAAIHGDGFAGSRTLDFATLPKLVAA